MLDSGDVAAMSTSRALPRQAARSFEAAKRYPVARAMRLVVLVVVATASRDPEPLEKLPAPPVTTPSFAEPSPPPPPPPPPLHSGPKPPPAVVSDFLAAHAGAGEPWTAKVFELTEPGRGFLGHRITRRRSLAPEQAMELARRLGEDASYIDDDYLGYGDPFGFELARGSATLRFVVSAGHLILVPPDEGHPVFSESMIEYLDQLRAKPGG
ncbi:MAG: hypothetical protein HOV81_06875 [Kofleriaceae bacterium]|nr:hypothetical protein [Kofleriaceae bacterium]